MNYLIVCHDNGAEMAPLISWLANDPKNTVMLATDRLRDDFSLPGARKIIIRKADFKLARESVPEYMGGFMRVAEKAAWSLKVLAESGFRPDIVLASSSGGLAFAIPDVFPDSPLVNYLESTSSWPGIEANARKLMQSMQVFRGQLAYAFGESARSDIPELLRQGIDLAPLAVDTNYFSPGKTPGQSVLFCLRGLGLQEYPAIIREAIRLAGLRRDVEIVISAPYPLASKFFGNKPDEAKLSGLKIFRSPTILGRRDLLLDSRLVICPKIGQDAIEAQSCGRPVITANAGPGRHALPDAKLAEYAADLLEDDEALAQKGMEGRADARENYDLEKRIPGHVAEILDALKRIY